LKFLKILAICEANSIIKPAYKKKQKSHNYDDIKYGNFDSLETALVIHFQRRQLTKPHIQRTSRMPCGKLYLITSMDDNKKYKKKQHANTQGIVDWMTQNTHITYPSIYIAE
jgi:hypothetical protein